MENSGVYLILNTKNNNKYVGSSIGLDKREYNHTCLLNKQTHGNIHLQRAWNKYGEDAFQFHILALCAREKKSLLSLEQLYINLLRPEYNILPTAGSRLGTAHTKETRAKMSVSQKGRKFTDEHKAKLSAGMMGHKYALGHKQTDEHKTKKVAAMKGYKHSAETRAKMSAQRKGKPWTPAQHAARSAYIRGR